MDTQENVSSGVATLQERGGVRPRPKNISVEEASNGFVVNLDYRNNVKVAKSKAEVIEIITAYLNNDPVREVE